MRVEIDRQGRSKFPSENVLIVTKEVVMLRNTLRYS
jgi:hypothetical protein